MEVLEVGDHAVFLSKFWSALPYLGKIVDLWQTGGGRMKVKINWLYHKDEVRRYCWQSGPLSLVEECRGLALIGRECCWRQLSYAIKNQLVASKAPY